MKVLRIVALFLGCMLVWRWFDLCGADLGIGETLPYCIGCSSTASGVRLVMLIVAVIVIGVILKHCPAVTQIYDNQPPLAQTYRIHWHRIALLLAILSFPLWVSWVDAHTIIPGPESLPFTRSTCHNSDVKGTMFWAIELIFVVWGFKILHRS